MSDRAEPNDDALLTEIGQLAVITGIIDGHLAGIAAVLVSPRITEIGYAVVGERTHFKQLTSLTKKIIAYQLSADDSPATDLLNPIATWIGDAERVMNHRNRLLHAVWMISVRHQATVLRRSGETEDVNLEKVRRYVADGEEVASRGGNLWETLIYRYGHLDALIEATKAMDPDWVADDHP